MTLGRRDLIIDLVLIDLFGLVLRPLLVLRWRPEALESDQKSGRKRLGRTTLRLLWALGFPIARLFGVRLLIGAALGAESWLEILSEFADFGAWPWAISIVMFATGVVRLALLQRVIKRRRTDP
ncbi:MAG: hypothetical protein ABI647_07185 [Gemmatimonadota bacterium]